MEGRGEGNRNREAAYGTGKVVGVEAGSAALAPERKIPLLSVICALRLRRGLR